MVADLKARRARLGITQAELARRLVVDRQVISSWENGRSKPSMPGLVEKELRRMEAEAGRSASSC